MARLLAPDRPDWRWARVADLSQYSDMQALSRLKHEDETTQAAFRFKRAFDRGMIDAYPVFEAAYELFMSDPQDRTSMEILLLAGADNNLIAEKLGIASSDVVDVYHDLFFAVRPYRAKATAWIASKVFGSFSHQGVHRNDRHGIALRLAWLGGIEVAIGLLDGDLSNEAVISALRLIAQGALVANAAETALTGFTRPDQAPEFFRISMDMEAAGGSGGEFEKQVTAFLDELTLTVADPTDQSNLELPAREERVAEYEVIEQ